MDIILYGVAFITGFGAAGLTAGSIAGGYAGGGDERFRPRPWCWPFCPGLFGGVLAVIVWALVEPRVDPALLVLTAGAVSFGIGAGGAMAWSCFQNLGGVQKG